MTPELLLGSIGTLVLFVFMMFTPAKPQRKQQAQPKRVPTFK